MKLNINKACDLASISVLPPRSRRSGGGASAAAASRRRSQTTSRQSFSQDRGSGGGASFSQGGGGGCAAFSQGRGGGGAAFSQNSGGGGASFSQGSGGGGAAFSQVGGGGGAAFSQGGGGAAFSQGGSGGSASFSQASLHHPSPARDQRFAFPDDSSKRMASFAANSASVVREESQLQLAKISSNCNPIHRWNPSLPERRCQMNEDLERKFQHLASSAHKIGVVVDSVHDDVMQLNRAKEASLDSDRIQKKFVLVENSVQRILKEQEDLKALLEGSTKSNPDLLSVLNYHTSKLDEISSTLPVLKKMPADLSQQKADIFRILTEEIEGMVRAISGSPDPTQMLADQSRTTNEKPMMNRTPVVKGSPQMNERPVADGRQQMKQTPVANGRSKMNQTPVANGISKMKQAPDANGKTLMKQIPVAKVLPAPLLVYRRRVKDLKPNIEEGMVAKADAGNLVGSSCGRVAPKQGELAIQKVDPQVRDKKALSSIIFDLDGDDEEEGSDGSASYVILNTETGAGGELMREEETSKEALEILRRAWKRRRREESKAIVLFRE